MAKENVGYLLELFLLHPYKLCIALYFIWVYYYQANAYYDSFSKIIINAIINLSWDDTIDYLLQS